MIAGFLEVSGQITENDQEKLGKLLKENLKFKNRDNKEFTPTSTIVLFFRNVFNTFFILGLFILSFVVGNLQIRDCHFYLL